MQAEEQPQNGIAGLRHWRNDFGTGLQHIASGSVSG
jgi:hypothetical protein